MRTRLMTLGAAASAALALCFGFALPAQAAEGDSARGTVKIEASEFGDSDNPNEVKVGCDFKIEFFGMERGRVPVTFTLQPPSGDRVIFRDTARVREAQGNESSGSLEVDLTDELAGVPPAQAQDYDYKVRVDAEVKSTEGNDSITKSAMLFIICADARDGAPVGGVAAGFGGAAEDGSMSVGAPIAGLMGALLLGGGAVAYGRRRRASA